MNEEKCFLVADSHLEPLKDSDTWRMFFSFLDFVGQEGADLYILGDLVDYWANNSLIRNKYKPLLDRLEQLAQARRVGVLIGNRDFLLRKSCLARRGIEFLGQVQQRCIGGRQVLMTHGDIFGEGDDSYRRFRKIGWPLLRGLDAVTPAIIANRVAEKLRRKSRKSAPPQPASGKTINDSLVQAVFEQGVDLIVCGHIHQPQVREYPAGRRLVVLPAWDARGGGYCLLSKNEVQLKEYP